MLVQATFGPSEKREVFTLSCNSEDDRNRWFEAFSEATKAFPYEESDRGNKNKSSRQSTLTDKKKANRTSKTLKNYKFVRMVERNEFYLYQLNTFSCSKL